MRPSTVFLDRDGVINRKPPDGEYVLRWDQFEFLPGVEQALALLAPVPVRVIVITNQRAVARQLLSAAELDNIHNRMRLVLQQRGARLDAVYACTHHIGTCACRKPGTGLLLQARSDFPDVDFSRSIVIGDSVSDLQPGLQLGCSVVLVGRGKRAGAQLAAAREMGLGDLPTARSLPEAIHRFVLLDDACASMLEQVNLVAGSADDADRGRGVRLEQAR